MPWFRVDDGFHSHPKTQAASPAALGLWVVAGSWCMNHLTDGRVPDDSLNRIMPRSRKLADELVAVGLWRRVKDGYQFHDWLKKNPSRKAVENERAAAAERQRRSREAKTSRRDKPVTHAVSHTTPALTQPSIAEVVTSTTGRTTRPTAKPGFERLNGAATPQPPPFAQAVADALNPERTP